MLNKIIEEKRDINAWRSINSPHKSGKAWDMVFKSTAGVYDVIDKELIRENAF